MTLKYYCDSFNATYCDKSGARHTIIKQVLSELKRQEPWGPVMNNGVERIRMAKKTLEDEGYTDVKFAGTMMQFVTFNDYPVEERDPHYECKRA